MGNGKVKVRLKIDRNTGEQTTEIIDHAEGAACEDGLDDDFLSRFSGYSLEGMKAIYESMSSGETMQWRQEKQQNAVQQKAQDLQNEEVEEEEEGPRTFRQEKELDKGFGV